MDLLIRDQIVPISSTNVTGNRQLSEDFVTLKCRPWRTAATRLNGANGRLSAAREAFATARSPPIATVEAIVAS